MNLESVVVCLWGVWCLVSIGVCIFVSVCTSGLSELGWLRHWEQGVSASVTCIMMWSHDLGVWVGPFMHPRFVSETWLCISIALRCRWCHIFPSRLVITHIPSASVNTVPSLSVICPTENHFRPCLVTSHARTRTSLGVGTGFR